MEIINGIACLPQVRELIREYTAALGRDLSFQDLQEEIQDPSKKYSPPHGELLVAVEKGECVGMVAYHRHDDARCEMKRLYVRPSHRGKGIGELLIKTILSRATASGFCEMVLDTIEPLHAAVRLYRRMGFIECAPYYYNPMDDVIYFRKDL